MSQPGSPVYVCDHSPAELERPENQGAFFEEITRRVFDAAGITTGMRVLDIGCSAGDVSFLVARLVGRSGWVLGIDRAPEAIEAATARGLRNVEFRLSGI